MCMIKGLSTQPRIVSIDHIHTSSQLIENGGEYTLPQCLSYIDYKNAFDSIESLAMLKVENENISPAQESIFKTISAATLNP